MRYCGYLDILMVFIFVRVILLLRLVRVFFFLFLCNNGIILLSTKIVNTYCILDLELIFNMWNFIFLIIVLIITIRVIFFSFSYIRLRRIGNFISLYLAFVLRICWLILNNNFYWIIFGWDGSGVVSFLLIVFYINFERVTNGLFTIFQNRVGDLFFVFFLLFRFTFLINAQIVLKWRLLFLILGSCVKRAQVPFNAWLLAAIRAPTPISSLVHSSTLVVAGVYILLEFSYCLCDYLEILKYLRILTLLISLFGLINERDIKKLIAYSTISHVGLILLIIRIQLFKITFFHLNIHAIFKSLIFICFGFTILHSYHAQDKRLVTYFSLSPIIKILYYYACFCLIGLPFLRGFFSKDFIIEKIIEFSFEFRNIFLLLIFLSVRIYYRIKLLRVYQIRYRVCINETQIVGLWGLIIIVGLRIRIINVFIRLIFRISLEFVSFKFIIYLFMLSFLLLSVLTNLNYKQRVYRKNLTMKELWIINWYSLDQFIFWSIVNVINYVRVMNNVKFILIINWWVIVGVIFFF